jgi:hypothetical protein
MKCNPNRIRNLAVGLLVATIISGHPFHTGSAQEAVIDVKAIAKLSDMIGKMDDQLGQLLQQTVELEAQTLNTENIKETSDATSQYTDLIKDYIGSAKEALLENIDELIGFENIEAAREFGITAVAVGKSLYGIYDTGKGIYDTGRDIYASFAELDGSIDDMVKQLEILSENRSELMSRAYDLTTRIGDAKNLSEVQKNHAAIDAAQLKMQAIHAQETEQTNLILLQQAAAENAKNRKIETDNQASTESRLYENEMVARSTDISAAFRDDVSCESDPWESE